MSVLFQKMCALVSVCMCTFALMKNQQHRLTGLNLAMNRCEEACKG